MYPSVAVLLSQAEWLRWANKAQFPKDVLNHKEIVLRLACVEPKCRSERMLAIKRCKHFELGGDEKGPSDPALKLV